VPPASLRHDSFIITQVLDAGWLDAYASRPDDATSNTSGHVKRLDFLFHTAHLQAVPRALPPLTCATPLPCESEPSDHLAIVGTFECA
jgi:hypothetical protein